MSHDIISVSPSIVQLERKRIAKDKNRLLIVMATGTGKTITAFQIVIGYVTSGLKKNMLADRNILIDQTMVQDFKPFKK